MNQQTIDAIDGERAYQKRKWGRRADTPAGTVYEESFKPVESYLLYMKTYLDKAIVQISTEATDVNALDTLRKVIALGVACANQHPLPMRVLDAEIINVRDGRPT